MDKKKTQGIDMSMTDMSMWERIGEIDGLPIIKNPGNGLACLIDPVTHRLVSPEAYQMLKLERVRAAAPEMLVLIQDFGRWLEAALTRGQIGRGTANRDSDFVTQIRALLARVGGK